ncbi:PDZ domain-containing protein [Brevibacterium sp. BRM-1]|uniref:YlbL family protein n=1 Tax=Brevibacterium sp. BRM-1 TaxID=2999062 RepID=UPI002280E1BA|nr:S16 family serine protease [Brevibacterium sp. BRM-1]WAL40504.1 PDZ domain-containing protein [Brevibacterium sp. BRM-1]
MSTHDARAHADAPARPAGSSLAVRRRRGGRLDSGMVSGLLTYALVLAAALVPVPYLIEVPGPVLNTFGSQDGKDVIAISGARTYPTQGSLDMLTVGVSGGPGRTVFASQALGAVLKRAQTVIPTESYYPLTTTRDEVASENAAQMAGSQDTATAAAMTELKKPYTSQIAVSEVLPDTPAVGKLRAGDRITAVNGTKITGDDAGAQAVQDAVRASATVTVDYRRGSERGSATLTPRDTDGQKAIGVRLAQQYDFPVRVTYNVSGIGGPSAGTIFALTIVDKLTPGAMTGGVPIAGTGEISPDGTVSPIGGARQKVAAAAERGAKYFLAPKDNCAEAQEAAQGEDITVVRIDTLHSARTSVERIGKHDTDSLPTCTSGGAQ